MNTVCAALEIHAQLEEEIFDPLSELLESRNRLSAKACQHDAMRATIASFRRTEPGTDEYDALFMTLTRKVMRHVAEEETILLPQAEKKMSAELRALGAPE